MPVDIGEAIISALKLVGELLVVDSKQVHDGGIQVMDVNGVLCNIITVVIRGAQ